MLKRLLQLPIGVGFRQSFAAGYHLAQLRRDLIAGLTVGIIAIPLAMALAIASGVAPQYGLYTCIVAGIIIAFTGGSRLNVSGPTAAFIVILYPVTQQFGIGGLLLATMMAGVLMLAMGLARVGKLIQFVPTPVIMGFTAGIAIVIATLQVKDFAGLPLDQLPAGYIEKVQILYQALPSYNSGDLIVGLTTLSVMIIWSRLPLRFPGHLFALAAGALTAQWLSGNGESVTTINQLFSYSDNGEQMAGIPPLPPSVLLPWQLPGANGEPLIVNAALLQQLLIPALGIALLGAIESLLCAVIADGMSGQRHHTNGELIGQGLGNIIAPFFGAITATAAIARTVANFKAGAFSPIAAIIHSIVVLLSVLFLSPLLSELPMAGLSALLLVIAWNMAELPNLVRLMQISANSDRLLLLATLVLTVAVDMVAAIAVGVIIAAITFVQRLDATVVIRELTQDNLHFEIAVPENVCILKFSGPLFFAAAQRTLHNIHQIDREIDTMIFYLDAVPIIDITAITHLDAVISSLKQRNISVIFADLQSQPKRALSQAGIVPHGKWLHFEPTLKSSLQRACQACD